MERCQPNIALLSGTCTIGNKNDHVTLGDVIVAKTAIKISSGADVKEERYRAQIVEMPSRAISDVEVETKKWKRTGALYLLHYKSKFPSRSMNYQRLWYTRLYLELSMVSACVFGGVRGTHISLIQFAQLCNNC